MSKLKNQMIILKNQIKISNSKSSYNLINDEKKLKKLVSEIYDAGEFVYDVETDSLNIIEANLVGVSFCFNQENCLLYSGATC